MKKNFYSQPEIEVVLVSDEDICTVSPVGSGDEDPKSWGDIWGGLPM